MLDSNGMAVGVRGGVSWKALYMANGDTAIRHSASSEKMKSESMGESGDIVVKLDRVFDAIEDMMVLISSDMAIQRINPALSTLLGYSSDELVGNPFSALLSPFDLFAVSGIETAFVGDTISNLNISFLCKNGSDKVLLTIGSKVYSESGDLIGYVLVGRDTADMQTLMIAESRAAAEEREKSQELREHTDILQKYHDETEEEKRLLQHLMSLMMQADGLQDPLIQLRVEAAENFSGDLVMATRGQNDMYFVMLADATGHGLPAAINLLPMTRIFYEMVRKGYSISSLLQEMNDTVKQYSPANRFVTATVVSVDVRNRVLEYWNGGNPPILVVDEVGDITHSLDSSNLPLGILPNKSLDTRTAKIQWAEGKKVQLFLCSDGLLDAENHALEQFGEERFLQVLKDSDQPSRFLEVLKSVEEHRAGAAQFDDITLICVDCFDSE